MRKYAVAVKIHNMIYFFPNFYLSKPMRLNIIILGGKTEFILNLVENRHKLFPSEFSRIVFCIPESLAHRPNPAFDRLKKTFPTVELVNGLPDISKLNLDLNQSPCLLIIDDQMNALLDSKEMVELLCIKIHHFQICTIFR